MSGELEPFNLETTGIEMVAACEIEMDVSFEVDADSSFHCGPQRRPSTGELGFSASGIYISTASPPVRGVLDPSSWQIRVTPTPWPTTFSTAANWKAVWKCRSGAEVIIQF
jgi:hypothetical protein